MMRGNSRAPVGDGQHLGIYSLVRMILFRGDVIKTGVSGWDKYTNCKSQIMTICNFQKKTPGLNPGVFFYLNFFNQFHGLADQFCGTAVFAGAGGAFAKHLAELAGAGEACEKAVDVLHQDGGGAAFGELLFYIG